MKFILLFLILHIPAFRVLAKQLPQGYAWLLPLYYVLQAGLLYWLTRGVFVSRRWARLLDHGFVLVLLIAVTASVSFPLYKYADGLAAIGRGSDQDNALIEGVLRMFQGMDPYGSTTYLGNPVSTGPGLLILGSPFALTGTWFLAGPFALFLTALMIRRASERTRWAVLYVLIAMSSLASWEALAAGSDLPFASALLVIAVLLIREVHARGGWSAWGATLLLVLVACSRVIFVYLIPFVFVLLFKRNRGEGLRFLGVSLFFLILVYLPFYVSGAESSPLHILGKGAKFAPWILVTGTIASLITGVLILLRVRDTRDSWMTYLFAALGVPLFFISLGDWWAHDMNLAAGQTATYLSMLTPVSCAWFILDRSETE